MRLMIEESTILFLPYGLGTLCIAKDKSKKTKVDQLPIDWQASKKVGKTVRLLNLHSNMEIMKFYWDKTTVIVKKHRFYKFEASRSNKRALATQIKTFHNLSYNGI
jgi:hypothetical protein